MVTTPAAWQIGNPKVGDHRKVIGDDGVAHEFELQRSGNGNLVWITRPKPGTTPPSQKSAGATGQRRLQHRTGTARCHSVAEARRLLGLPPKRST